MSIDISVGSFLVGVCVGIVLSVVAALSALWLNDKRLGK